MNIFSKIKRWFITHFLSRAKQEFDVESIASGTMEGFVRRCINIYKGYPEWIDNDDGITTIGFAKAVCTETARLATLAMSVKLDGSQRADWLQKQIDRVYYQIRHWVEYAAAAGTVALKPSTQGIDMLTPDSFALTDIVNGEVRGAVFYDQRKSSDGHKYYTRIEYHRFLENGNYAVTNRCFVGYSENDDSRPIDISLTPWAGLLEEVEIEGIDRPLFAVLRMPGANHIDFNSVLGVPVFSDAIQELKDLDVAYSRNSNEIEDSKRTVLIDSDRLLPGVAEPTSWQFEQRRKEMKLPNSIKNVSGVGIESYYQEINPTLSTDTRLVGINALINQIGYKCGFANGYFVFNEKSGLTTATEIEADQQRTIQFIKDVRDKLEEAIKDLVYALNALADLYNLAPSGVYNEDSMIKFGSITYSFEAERQHYYGLAVQGKYPWKKYYTKFLGCTEEEADELLAMVKSEQAAPTLFGFSEE